MSTVRSGHTATLLQNGKVLIAGGWTSDPWPEGRTLASAELYDPATGKFSATGDMLVARYWHTVGTAAQRHGPGDRRIGQRRSLLCLFQFSCTTRPPVPGVRPVRLAAGSVFHTATLLTTGHVLVAGGHTPRLVEGFRWQWRSCSIRRPGRGPAYRICVASARCIPLFRWRMAVYWWRAGSPGMGATRLTGSRTWLPPRCSTP